MSFKEDKTPNDKSILFDLDSTLFDMEKVWVERIGRWYPDIQKIDLYPMTEKLLPIKNVLCALCSQEAVYTPRFYADEPNYVNPINLVRKLIEFGFDIWFVTGIPLSYHAPTAIIEKRAQIQRIFGSTWTSKIIYTFHKYSIPGLYLIDDHPNLLQDEQKARWKGVFVQWAYNENIQCDRRVSLDTMHKDFLAVVDKDNFMQLDDALVQQMQNIE